MKELVIIGAGGMGREVFDLATQCDGYGRDYVIKGFIDDWVDALDSFKGYPPVLGSFSDYPIQENDVFTCSLGDIQKKVKVCERILADGGEFLTLIHPRAQIGKNSKIGTGVIILFNAYIGADSVIGDFALVQIAATIGHDVQIGRYSRIDGGALCVGGTRIGDEVVIHTSAVINHRVVVESRATVGAGSLVIRKVKAGSSVFGNPAKKMDHML